MQVFQNNGIHFDDLGVMSVAIMVLQSVAECSQAWQVFQYGSHVGTQATQTDRRINHIATINGVFLAMSQVILIQLITPLQYGQLNTCGYSVWTCSHTSVA
jgi:hypothetical protein